MSESPTDLSESEGLRFLDVASSLLKEGKQVAFHARGQSMAPFIKNSDRLIISPPSGPLLPGDIALYKALPERPVVHRILSAKQADHYLARGDAVSEPLEKVPVDTVLGIVTEVQSVEGESRMLEPGVFPLQERCWVMGQSIRRWLRRGFRKIFSSSNP